MTLLQPELLAHLAGAYPTGVAWRNMTDGNELTLEEWDRRSNRLARGLPPVEKADGEDEKVLVWPDLVYTELIAMVVCTLVLVVWAVFLKAPLEQPASSFRIPNPSKAP